MPRTASGVFDGMVFHVLNRANNCADAFKADEAFIAFLRVLRDTLEEKPIRILSFCLMLKFDGWGSCIAQVKCKWAGHTDNCVGPRTMAR
jgi:hypothetical protein